MALRGLHLAPVDSLSSAYLLGGNDEDDFRDEIKEECDDDMIVIKHRYLSTPHVVKDQPLGARFQSKLTLAPPSGTIMQEALLTERVPTSLEWVNVDYKIGSKSILSACYGSVPAESICAIMGPSGSGKTSLLNVLSGRTNSTQRSGAKSGCCDCLVSSHVAATGSVFINGVRIDPMEFHENIAYVMQEPALMETATPREALMFAAALRLPAANRTTFCHECGDCSPCCYSQGGPRFDIETLVTNTLKDLQLEACADLCIGGGLIKGISGGEAKRVSVGVEIITNPAVSHLLCTMGITALFD
jgi:Fe-S cluster assembly ATPase SufC